MRPKPGRPRSSKLDPYTGYVDQRLDEGLENCVVLQRELRNLGYDGGYSILKSYVSPRRRRRQPQATVRFETEPGEQAQVDWGSLAYLGEDGKKRRIWVFVMTMGCSRACYVELVRRADTAAFIQCHVNAFEYLSGVPHRCLYDNAKVITLGRDEEKRPVWNQRMLDFALRVGFEARLCQPYRAQTKGKVESGVKYVRRNMWPSLRFTDDADLNRQTLQWCDGVANRLLHGTTHRLPAEMLAEEQPHLGQLPERNALAPYLKGRTGRWPGTASSARRAPATASTGNGWERRFRWARGGAPWRSGPTMSASRSIPGPSGLVSASSCLASGRACPGEIAGPVGKRWRCRYRWVRWSGAPWMCTSWHPGRWQVIALEQARQYLETLGLKQSVEVLDNTLDVAANKQLTYPEMLADLLGVEVAARRERYLSTRTKMAHLPFQRTLDQFDFAFQSSVDERQSLPPCRRGSRNWRAWPSCPRPPTSCCWDRPAWARRTCRWRWPSRPSRTGTGPTLSGPTT